MPERVEKPTATQEIEMKNRFTRITLAALCLSLTLPALAADEKPPAEGDQPVVTGNPPDDSSFARIKPGMRFADAAAILGKPTSEYAYCTGKHTIPFYFGSDKARTNQHFKGQGVVIFYTAISTFGIGRYKSCTPKQPLEVAEVHYDINETGVASESEEPKKEPAEAAK
jgi:outer membrane protein assembly factor BamE (lipoprotein component of BamABCDE complex)